MKFHLIRRVLRLRAEQPGGVLRRLRAARPRPRPRRRSSAAAAIRVVVPLRAGDRADGGDRDLLPEYGQELSVLA